MHSGGDRMTDEPVSGHEQPSGESPLAGALRAALPLVGSVAGAGLGLVVGGDLGSLVGAGAGPAVTQALQRVGDEVTSRRLSPRQRARVGSVIWYTTAKIKANQDGGAAVRSDGFFDAQQDDRSAAEEIAEAVLLAAEQEYEERKLRYLGNL